MEVFQQFVIVFGVLAYLKIYDANNLVELKIFYSSEDELYISNAHYDVKRDKLQTYGRKPKFSVVWNIPSDKCHSFGCFLNLSYYDIISNLNENFTGNSINIFYNIGLFPYIDDNNQWFNGGLPQLGNLTHHLEIVKRDVEETIPKRDFCGLGIIDQEKWRPIWERDWDRMEVYRSESRKLVRKEHPTWNPDDIEKEAKRQFELSARAFMETTLQVITALRPWGSWGYYSFPDCYNHYPGQRDCSEKVKEENDRLSWLFEASRALYPSIYLSHTGMSPDERALYVYGHLSETRRVMKSVKHKIRAYPYMRIFYRDYDREYCLTCSTPWDKPSNSKWMVWLYGKNRLQF
ncbi:hyaluronidase-like isoform X2 [Limulus polyphemus]|uniref:Hyaluronidase n=1 Tax=Limulus polyphemus TaxID=6850 RepID=A0ABM1SC84_LIMPO|nr:hyaluronidase-like isoform X2 [Limulus polyphemus]